MEEQDQEQQNKSDGFLKQQTNKGKEIAKDQAKKQAKNKIKTMIMKNPKVALIVLAVIVALILIVILLAGAVYLINYLQEKEGSQAKEATISFALSGNTEEVESAEQKKVTISKSEEGNYKINVNYTEEEFKELEKKQTEIVDFSKFTDFEKGVIFALNENGLNLSDYTEDQLKCLPAFIKAEGSTQYLDLRENKDKQSGKKVGDYIDKYEPENMEDLEEDEIPGTVLVQRTNTAEEDPVTLQYMEKEEFEKMVEDKDMDVLNYFSMTDTGELIIAKWSYTKISVSGDYPDTIPEEQRDQSKEELTITTEELAYVETIKNYVMPFDFLLQLLIISEDPQFCLDLVDMVLDTKIIINIQEEQTKTHRVQVRTYDVHNKENKFIDYKVGNNIESGTDVFLKKTKDDEKKDCTTYNKEQFKVTITTDTTSHSYKPEIIEADSWIAYYKNEYDDPEKKVTNPEIDPQEIKGKYGEPKTIQKEGEDAEADPDAAEFKAKKETEYKSKIPAPPVVWMNEFPSGNKYYKRINITNSYETNLSQYVYEGQEVKDENGDSKYVYSLPPGFQAYKNIGVNGTTVKVYYNFTKNGDIYSVSTSNVDTVFQCNIINLKIDQYQKTDALIETTEEITKYETDPEPKKTIKLYAKDEDGNLEKFLKIFDENRNARELIYSVEDWLFEMMEENSNTSKLSTIIKYLLYLYDGKDRGVTELDLKIFEPGEFKSVSTFMNLAKYLRQFSHAGEAPQTDDHKFYKMYGDSVGWPTIGTADIQWASHHAKFNKEGTVLENGVEKTVPSVETYVNEKIGHSQAQLSDSAIDSLNIYIDAKLVDEIGNDIQKVYYEYIEKDTEGLELSKQQMFALTAIVYNIGEGNYQRLRNGGYTFVKAYNEGAAKFEINSWEHNRYIWDKWWAYIGGGSPGHIPARDAAFETYVKGVFDFSTSEAGEVFGRNYYIYYTENQRNMYSYAPPKKITRNPNDKAHEEEIFTYVQGAYGGETLEVCEQIMNEMIGRGVRYGFPAQGDIEATLNAKTACCATYVAQVLFVSGLLPAEHINKYAYNSCFVGISPMLRDAGWTLIGSKNSRYDGTQGTIALEDIEPGDVVIVTGHVVIYAGDNYIYDQNCGVISTKGRPPIKSKYQWMTKGLSKSEVEVWRAP